MLSKPKRGRHPRILQNFSATMPRGLHQAFKDLAGRMRDGRSPSLGNAIYVQDLYDEAIAHLVKAIDAGEDVHFLPVPREGTERKTFIVGKRTYALVGKIAKRRNVSITVVAFTSFSCYLQKFGPDLYGKIQAAANRKQR